MPNIRHELTELLSRVVKEEIEIFREVEEGTLEEVKVYLEEYAEEIDLRNIRNQAINGPGSAPGQKENAGD